MFSPERLFRRHFGDEALYLAEGLPTGRDDSNNN